MGAWDSGPFDNDSAADRGKDLAEAAPDERAGKVRQALLDAAECADYLEEREGARAVAAAAVVAAACCGGPSITSSYAPDFLREDGRIGLPDDLVPLALRALDRVLGADSELWELWQESDGGRSLLAQVEPLRAALTQGTAG